MEVLHVKCADVKCAVYEYPYGFSKKESEIDI